MACCHHADTYHPDDANDSLSPPMEMGDSPPAAPDLDLVEAETVVRMRRIALECQDPSATPERLSIYLSLRDRPVIALLAQERLQELGAGRFLYRSRPFRLLRLELIPTLELQARWLDPHLELVCEKCQIVGLGPWGRGLSFEMGAILQAEPAGLKGELRVSLRLSRSLPGWTRTMAGRCLERVVERIESRVRSRLQRDLRKWLLEGN
jgi:hypothetical protein